MMNIKQFCNRHNITILSEMVGENPYIQEGMPVGSYHYKVTLRRSKPRRQLTTYFSMGPALCYEPTASEVLDCLVSDISSYENARSFEDWASDFGYDTDSRRAERIYVACGKIARNLKRFLGSEFETCLYDVERE